MAVMTAGSAEHRARIAELEGGLGPFDDPEWREDLSLLASGLRVGALSFLADCETIVALAERVPRSPGDERGGTAWTSFVREVAVAMKISDRAAHAEIALAQQLLRHHPVTVAALGAGQVPAHRARSLVELCARYGDRIVEVADRLLGPRLNSLPPWQLKQEVELLALRLDPEGAARREAVATAGRGASLQPLPDAQAEAVLTGPAPLVQRWWDALTARARALKAAGDPRTLGALRFDLAVQTDPSALTGCDALSQAVGIDPPATARPAAPAAAEPALAPESVQDETPATLPTPDAPAGLATVMPHDARCTRPVQATITVPATTALGLGDEPGWLDGYGWISAPLSRRLLTVAELRKACVAPHSGQVLDLAPRVERPASSPTGIREAVRRMVLAPHELRPVATAAQPQHDPSPALEALVQARDRWCDGPTGTQVPARRTDTDHEIAWPAGPTAAWNLVSRSPRTHQLKHAGWRPVRDGRGTTWTSPAGQVAFTPRFDHPPEPPAADRQLPDPDALAARDAALARTPDLRPDQCEVPPTSTDEPTRAARGWPDDPPF